MFLFSEKQNQHTRPPSRSHARPQTAAPAAARDAHPFLHLQRTIGNQAVQRLLSEGQKNSAADASANLTISRPGDPYEREADRVAEQVVRADAPRVTHSDAPGLLRQATEGGAGANVGGVAAPPLVGDALRSRGEPLDAGTRGFMESRLGQDFGGVRVHSDARAAESARSVGALAYTVGRDIVFDSGRYAPQTAAGRRLLAHELGHVVQQRASARPLLQRQDAGATTPTETTDEKKESAETEEEKKEAAVASSLSEPFDVPWRAAFKALTIANPLSILSTSEPNVIWGIEYGGLIFKLNGKYHYTYPMRGEEGSVDVWKALARVPKEAQMAIVGDYHTHGGPVLPGTGEDFSGFRESPEVKERAKKTGAKGDIEETEEDVKNRKEILDKNKYTAFLATPQGRFTIFIPAQSLVFSFSPDERLLPPGQKVKASAYAH